MLPNLPNISRLLLAYLIVLVAGQPITLALENSAPPSSLSAAIPQGSFSEKLINRMDYLLSLKRTEISGPNCYSSVLFSLGISPGIYFSTNEIEIWLHSPLCREVDSESIRIGDIISYRAYGRSSGHIMMLRSLPDVALNKNNGAHDSPYELVSLSQYPEQDSSRLETKKECSLISNKTAIQNNCKQSYTSLYRCSDLKSYMRVVIKENLDTWERFQRLGAKLTQYFIGESELGDELTTEKQALSASAKAQIKVPYFNELPDKLQQIIKDSYNGFALSQYDLIAARYFIQSHASIRQKLPVLNRINEEFTKAYGDSTSKIPAATFLFWSNIYLSTARPLGWN